MDFDCWNDEKKKDERNYSFWFSIDPGRPCLQKKKKNCSNELLKFIICVFMIKWF